MPISRKKCTQKVSWVSISPIIETLSTLKLIEVFSFFCESSWPKNWQRRMLLLDGDGKSSRVKSNELLQFFAFFGCQLIYDLLASRIHAKRRNCLLASLLIRILIWSQEAFRQSLLNIKSYIKAILKLSFSIWHISFDIKVRNPKCVYSIYKFLSFSL